MTVILPVTGAVTPELVAALNENFAKIDAKLDEILGRRQIKTANFTASANGHYDVDTSGGEVTAAMPADPDTTVSFNDRAGTWGTNNLIIEGSGTKFDLGPQGLKDRLICDGTASIVIGFDGTNLTVR